ncbi:MAG TPA: hypothetical protein VHN73_03910, partial [Phenylobacterium sp.]|nr:hypothetical protein [Phenylobacterium sp.]
WVAGAPNGYYDASGRWITANTAGSAAGYYDSNGHWVPASAPGYYDANGRYVTGASSGHYENGRWVAGATTGHYLADGRWMPGKAMGHRDANGVWIAAAQPGYYDTNGRWRAGETRGYYDGQGRWVATSATVYGSPANYIAGPRDTRARESFLEDRIRQGRRNGSLSVREARNATRSLSFIRREEASMRRYNGRLNSRDEAYIQAKLDDLSRQVRVDRRD